MPGQIYSAMQVIALIYIWNEVLVDNSSWLNVTFRLLHALNYSKLGYEVWFKPEVRILIRIYVSLFFFSWKKILNLFNLDSTPTKTDVEDKTDYKEKWRIAKVTFGSAIGCITALAFFIVGILYLRRRYNRLEQEVKEEVEPLR